MVSIRSSITRKAKQGTGMPSAVDGRAYVKALEAWRAKLPGDFEGFTDEEVRSWRDRSPGRPVDLG